MCAGAYAELRNKEEKVSQRVAPACRIVCRLRPRPV